MDFPTRLRDLRKEANLTQEELAKKIDQTKANISKYETGRIQPSFETLDLFTSIFDCSIDYLLCKTPTRKWDTEGLAFSAHDIDGLTDEDIAAVKLIIEGLKAKHQAKKK